MIFFKTTFQDQDICVFMVLSKISHKKLEYYLHKMNISSEISKRVREIINYDNTGFTYSKGNKTMMFINKQESLEEFVNTYEHEKNHLEMYLCQKYNIDPYSEEASILSGELSKILFLELTNVILQK